MPRQRIADAISKERMEQLYIRDGLTTLTIADRLNFSREAVRRLIHRYGIQMRSKGAGMAAKHRH